LLSNSTTPARFFNVTRPKGFLLREYSTMKSFTKHPRKQGITYLEHWCFAMGIACRLLSSVIAFAVHALFPFISIRPELDLEATATFIKGRNEWIEADNERRANYSTLNFKDCESEGSTVDAGNTSMVV